VNGQRSPVGVGPRAFVIGWPIFHSRSPLIHGHWLKTLGLEGSYEALEVAPEELSEFLRTAPADGFVGGNVTVPHKESVFAAISHTDAAARRLKAVNTLWREQGAWHGANTDGYGFLANLDEQVPEWAAGVRTAAVIGAGGAARAIVSALMERGVSRFFLINRTEERAARLAADLGAPATVVPLEAPAAALAEADLLVNASSLGMTGAAELVLDLAPLPAHAVVADIVYVPLETALLRRAKGRGLRTCDGLGMLLHQAVPGFERWFGRRPKVTEALRRLVIADLQR
jgi:shikimate dehydrogenase